MLDQRDVKRLVDTAVVLGAGSAIVLVLASVSGLAIRLFTALAWGGC